jgi:hypothetical protein
LEVGPKAREKLERMSEETEQSFSDVIRNALAVYDLLWSELKTGRKLVIQEPDGKDVKEIVLPEFRS